MGSCGLTPSRAFAHTCPRVGIAPRGFQADELARMTRASLWEDAAPAGRSGARQGARLVGECHAGLQGPRRGAARASSECSPAPSGPSGLPRRRKHTPAPGPGRWLCSQLGGLLAAICQAAPHNSPASDVTFRWAPALPGLGNVAALPPHSPTLSLFFLFFSL